jgi:PAS domain S-box-containing protein
MENDLSRVVDLLPGLVWTALPDGQVDFLNQRWCEYTGLSVAEACGEGWQSAIHSDDLPELRNRWRSILASTAAGEMEARLRRSDGEYRWFLFRTRPLTDASGQIAKWCGLNIDIEEVRQAEEALDARERHFKLIFDGLPALIILMNPDGDLVRANRHCLEFFGATLEELQARGQVHSYHPGDRPRVFAAWKRSLETGRPYVSEGRRRRADGVYRWFHTRGLPLRDAEGRIVLWYSLATDVDDQKRAEALLAGEKRVLEMAAGSHSMSEILDALCQLVENTTTGCYCSVALVDASGTHLEHGVFRSASSTQLLAAL